MITKEQKEFKKGKIGSSQAAAALGLSQWCSPAALYLELLGLIEPFQPDPVRLRIGNKIEPIIASEYMERPGAVELFEDHESHTHREYPWMIAHVDRRKANGGIVELKNVGITAYRYWGADGDPRGVPIDVQCQCIHQAEVCGVEDVEVAALFGGNELRVYPVDVGPNARKRVVKDLVAFWENYVVKRVEPKMTAQDIALIKRLYQGANEDVEIEISSDVLLRAYRQAVKDFKTAEKKKDGYKAALQQFMGDNTILTCSGDVEITWRKAKDGSRRFIDKSPEMV